MTEEECVGERQQETYRCRYSGALQGTVAHSGDVLLLTLEGGKIRRKAM